MKHTMKKKIYGKEIQSMSQLEFDTKPDSYVWLRCVFVSLHTGERDRWATQLKWNSTIDFYERHKTS